MTYTHRTDEFPHRNLANGTQLGWIADDVKAVVPELVQQDDDGFLAVSYGRATAVVAQAVSELREQYDAKLAAMAAEFDEKLQNAVSAAVAAALSSSSTIPCKCAG